MGSIYRFTLDLHSTQSQVFIPVPKGDTAREWHISLSDGGVPYIIEDGSVATIEIKRPRGGILQYFCPIVNHRIVIYDFNNDDVTRSTATEDGIHECDILITSEKGEFASARFTMLVSDRVVNNVSLTEGDFDTLADIRWKEGQRQTYYENLKKRVDAGEFNGKDYVLTDADRTEIAEEAASIMPKEVVNITTIDETYETVADLPTDKGEGTTLLVLSEKSLYSYNSTAKAWEFKSALKPHTVYCVLEGEKAGLYRFTMTSPYLVSVESHTLQDAIQYAVPRMNKIDEARVKAYEEDGGYYFSASNWNTFRAANNRVYVERGDDRGVYGMYALSYNADPIYNAWYKKADWEEKFAKDHPGEAFREPFPDEYPLLDSVVQRHGDGQIVVPLIPKENRDATSKEYVDIFADALERYQKQFAGTEGLAYDLVSDHYRLKGLGTVPNGSYIEIGSFVNGYPVTEIASNAFPNNTIKSIRVPATINKFGNNAFGWSGKVDIVFVDDVAKWAAATFEGSGSPVTTQTKKIYIKDVYSDTLTIPEGVTKISQRAFMHWTQFKSILLPESLETISDTAFQYCSGLETLIIPAGVKSVGLAAIDRCTSLKTVLFEGKPEEMKLSVFAQDTALTDIYVKWGMDEIPGAPWAAPNATVWYYSESKPTVKGDYWHYVDGVPSKWDKPLFATEGLEYASSDYGLMCVGIGTATEDTIVIPENVDGEPVSILGIKAFAWGDEAVKAKTVILPYNMTKILAGSLSAPSIKKVVIRSKDYDPETLMNFSVYPYDTKFVYNDGCTPFRVVEIEPYSYSSGADWRATPSPEFAGNEWIEELHVPWAANHEYMNYNAPWGLENATIIYESEESFK
jgi:hypothetical protein